MAAERPRVRLKPGASAQSVRHGAPWVYASDLVLDRRTKALAPGVIADLEDAERVAMATVAFNSASKLAVRVLERTPGVAIDRAWLTVRLRLALEHRDRLYPAPYYRWIHAEGDGLPGVVIDRFGETVVLQPNAAWAETLSGEIAAAVREAAPQVLNVLKNAGGRSRAQEGLDDAAEVLEGTSPGTVEVPMNGALYMADLDGGQKTGLFFDQRDNHAFFQSLAGGRTVLDVFAHVGGFGLAALAGGAASALAVDASEPALALARRGAGAMGRAGHLETRQGDAFAAMEALAAEGRSFGAVVADPPAFAPSKNALAQGLRAYERVARLAAKLVEPGGYLALCSCSHAAELPKFLAACTRGIGRAGREAQLVRTGFAGADHPQHPALASSGYLKALFFRVLR